MTTRYANTVVVCMLCTMPCIVTAYPQGAIARVFLRGVALLDAQCLHTHTLLAFVAFWISCLIKAATQSINYYVSWGGGGGLMMASTIQHSA